IDIDTLGHLTEDDLKSLGVSSLGHRKKILAAASRSAAEAETESEFFTVRKSPGRTASPSNISPAQQGYYDEPMPPTHMAIAILTTLFCCLPFGLIAIIHASGVSTAHATGNYELAMKKSSQARNWANAAIIGWLLLFGLYFVLGFLGFLSMGL
ncbi:MAG: CD225/dispanin family protein, partial [Myxococcota bacterium]|nr:CD225/dispanin family protein [Myxococcota bacterium]